MRSTAIALVVALVAAALAVPSAPARAAGTPLRVCNHSSIRINVAGGYHSPGTDNSETVLTGPFVSKGWYVLEPGECVSIPNPFSARYMYWSGYTAQGVLWNDGDVHFCVPNLSEKPPRFTFEEENQSQAACEGSAYDSAGPNQWIVARRVDVADDPSDEYTGN